MNIVILMMKRYVAIIVFMVAITLVVDIYAMGIESEDRIALKDDVRCGVTVMRSNVGSETQPESRVLIGNGRRCSDYSQDKKELNALMDKAVVGVSTGLIVAMFLIWLGR